LEVHGVLDGCIKAEYTVWCGVCSKWESCHPAKSKKEAVIVANKLKWRYTKGRGWVCPQCQVR
jgi:hypothetical protein